MILTYMLSVIEVPVHRLELQSPVYQTGALTIELYGFVNVSIVTRI